MGTRGPIAKRSSQQLGHKTKAEKAAIEHVEMIGDVVIPPAKDSWHELARDWYLSLTLSGQAKFYEPSDWLAAQLVAAEMTRMLANRVSAQLFGVLWTAMGDLLTTEGERRRVKVEIDRKPSKPERKLASVTPIDAYGAL